eukprot:Rhum_TRINITY_DN14369_c5_g9::Rhum_TRINITY_DN14369_c5_g9_i1::g.86702::m.86702/K08857/NEK1_4_5; NIMA (never in mitosis gene a)-related kinase 1/4/5
MSHTRRLQDKYELVKKVGTGSFGSAFLYHRLKDNQPVVLKVLHTEPEQRPRVINEIKILKALRHSNITAFHEAWREGDFIYICMEYADGGDLKKAIARKRASGVPFTEDVVRSWVLQLASALYYIHSAHVLHRDLKAANVFLTHAQQVVKLGDFGISKQLSRSEEYARTTLGTPFYLSPEIVKGRRYNAKSDVWAAGVITHELMTFDYPYKAHSQPELFRLIERGGRVDPPALRHYSDELRELLAKMLERDCRLRFSSLRVIMHPALRAAPAQPASRPARPPPAPHSQPQVEPTAPAAAAAVATAKQPPASRPEAHAKRHFSARPAAIGAAFRMPGDANAARARGPSYCPPPEGTPWVPALRAPARVAAAAAVQPEPERNARRASLRDAATPAAAATAAAAAAALVVAAHGWVRPSWRARAAADAAAAAAVFRHAAAAQSAAEQKPPVEAFCERPPAYAMVGLAVPPRRQAGGEPVAPAAPATAAAVSAASEQEASLFSSSTSSVCSNEDAAEATEATHRASAPSGALLAARDQRKLQRVEQSLKATLEHVHLQRSQQPQPQPRACGGGGGGGGGDGAVDEDSDFEDRMPELLETWGKSSFVFKGHCNMPGITRRDTVHTQAEGLFCVLEGLLGSAVLEVMAVLDEAPKSLSHEHFAQASRLLGRDRMHYLHLIVQLAKYVACTNGRQRRRRRVPQDRDATAECRTAECRSTRLRAAPAVPSQVA